MGVCPTSEGKVITLIKIRRDIMKSLLLEDDMTASLEKSQEINQKKHYK